MARLAQTLLGLSECALGDAQRGRLEDTLARASSADSADLQQTELLIVELGGLVDAAIMEAGRPGTIPSGVLEAVLAYGETQAHRERVWFSATKLDPDVSELEDIPAMLGAG